MAWRAWKLPGQRQEPGPAELTCASALAQHEASLASRYAHVGAWADKPEIADQLRGILGVPNALHSPNGLDANDLLQRDLLADFLAEVLDRVGAATRSVFPQPVGSVSETHAYSVE